MSAFPSSDSLDRFGPTPRKTSKAFQMADGIFGALTGRIKPKTQPPAPVLLEPTPAVDPSPAISAHLTFGEGTVYQLASSGMDMVRFIVSSDWHACSLCGRSGEFMGSPDGHAARCPVRHFLDGIDQMHVSLEVTK